MKRRRNKLRDFTAPEHFYTPIVLKAGVQVQQGKHERLSGLRDCRIRRENLKLREFTLFKK